MDFEMLLPQGTARVQRKTTDLRNSLGFLLRRLKDILTYKEFIGSVHFSADDRVFHGKNALYNLCIKIHPKEKILLFTQFADTAYYLRGELKKRSINHIEYVTGDSEDPTTCAYRFSPISHDKKEIANTPDEIRVLITTDVLSEALKRAIDDIYKFPLKEFARETLNRQLKAGISDEELANLVVSLRDEDKLCNTKEDEKTYKEPQIICSLGLIK